MRPLPAVHVLHSRAGLWVRDRVGRARAAIRRRRSRRRRGHSVETGRGGDADIPWRRVAATPRLRRGYSVEMSIRRRRRGAAATPRRRIFERRRRAPERSPSSASSNSGACAATNADSSESSPKRCLSASAATIMRSSFSSCATPSSLASSFDSHLPSSSFDSLRGIASSRAANRSTRAREKRNGPRLRAFWKRSLSDVVVPSGRSRTSSRPKRDGQPLIAEETRVAPRLAKAAGRT